MGYARATRKSGETAGTWAEAFRNVFSFLFRRSQSVSNVRTPVQTMVANNPYTMGDGEVAVSFRVGCRYFDSTKNRVFECIALNGKRARSVAFGCLDSIECDKSLLKDFGGFKKTRIDGGAETCERGALRADRPAAAGSARSPRPRFQLDDRRLFKDNPGRLRTGERLAVGREQIAPYLRNGSPPGVRP